MTTGPNTAARPNWRANLTSLLGLSLGIIAFDQLTKALITSSILLGQSVPVVPGLMHFTLVRNTGMAFGLLSSSDIPYKSFLVTLFSVVAMGAVTFYALRASSSEWLTRIGLTLILGGACGNIIDRVHLGYVVDFIDVFYRGAHWPAFNVADSSICIGVGLLLLDSFRRREPESATEVPVRAE